MKRYFLASLCCNGLLGGGIWNMMRPFPQIWLLLDGLYHIT